MSVSLNAIDDKMQEKHKQIHSGDSGDVQLIHRCQRSLSETAKANKYLASLLTPGCSEFSHRGQRQNVGQ